MINHIKVRPNCYDQFDCCMKLLQYPKLTVQDIEYMLPFVIDNYPPYSYKFLSAVSCHSVITIDWLLRPTYSWWDIEETISNPNITTKIVEKYPNFEWNWQFMDDIKDLNGEFVLAHRFEDWNWESLSSRLNIEFILENPDFQWCYYHVGRNKTITLDTVITNPQIEWFVESLVTNTSFMKDITLDKLLRLIDQNTTEISIIIAILKHLIKTEEVSNDLVTKMRHLPEQVNATKWFFEGKGYITYLFNQTTILNPTDIDAVIYKFIPIETINEKVSNYYDKIETEVASVGTNNFNIGQEGNHGLRQIIRSYL